MSSINLSSHPLKVSGGRFNLWKSLTKCSRKISLSTLIILSGNMMLKLVHDAQEHIPKPTNHFVRPYETDSLPAR